LVNSAPNGFIEGVVTTSGEEGRGLTVGAGRRMEGGGMRRGEELGSQYYYHYHYYYYYPHHHRSPNLY